jgi:hypothetical protein
MALSQALWGSAPEQAAQKARRQRQRRPEVSKKVVEHIFAGIACR